MNATYPQGIKPISSHIIADGPSGPSLQYADEEYHELFKRREKEYDQLLLKTIQQKTKPRSLFGGIFSWS